MLQSSTLPTTPWEFLAGGDLVVNLTTNLQITQVILLTLNYGIQFHSRRCHFKKFNTIYLNVNIILVLPKFECYFNVFINIIAESESVI